jgi:hypothetical protein
MIIPLTLIAAIVAMIGLLGAIVLASMSALEMRTTSRISSAAPGPYCQQRIVVALLFGANVFGMVGMIGLIWAYRDFSSEALWLTPSITLLLIVLLGFEKPQEFRQWKFAVWHLHCLGVEALFFLLPVLFAGWQYHPD